MLPFVNLRLRAELAARRAGRIVAGAFCALVGVGFLTAALWLALADAWGGLVASLVVGVAFAAIGLFLVLRPPRVGRVPPAAAPVAAAAPAAMHPVPALLDAFALGMEAGARSRRARRS